MLSFVEKTLLEKHEGVVLVRATSENGHPFYLYLRSTRPQLEELDEAIEGKQFIPDFKDYGHIVVKGWGEAPSKEHRSFMEEMYQFDHDKAGIAPLAEAEAEEETGNTEESA